jgi:hypothetical protein
MASDGTVLLSAGKSQSNGRRHKLKQFLFFTTEGFTFDPHHEELHNMQILGDGMGNDVLEAFKNFKHNQSYLLEYAYKEVIAVQYVGDMIRHLEL